VRIHDEEDEENRSAASSLPWTAPMSGIATQRCIISEQMSYPIKTCVACGDEFELKPGKPGFADRCPSCSEEDAAQSASHQKMTADERKNEKEANEARRQAMRNLLYRKDS
jgi:hypothetical protein